MLHMEKGVGVETEAFYFSSNKNENDSASKVMHSEKIESRQLDLKRDDYVVFACKINKIYYKFIFTSGVG
jgi:hypothetical protein